jgi:hypothetical protein
MPIQIKDNFLPQEIIDKIYNTLDAGGWKYGWRSNPGMGYSHWNQKFADHELMENGLDISDRLLNETLQSAWQYIQENHFPNSILLRCYANAHTYGVEGYPHSDSNRIQDETIVVYLNKTWRKEWGGETSVFLKNDIEKSVLPLYNRAMIFPGAAQHVSRNVTRICPELRITVMFKIAPIGSDPDRDRAQNFLMELGTDKVPHGNRNLARHSLCVYDLLKVANQDTATCLAGAFHSIFGTNSFKTTTLQQEEKTRLIEVIGEEAANLAELFGTIQRPLTLETALREKVLEVTNSITNTNIPITEKQLNSLLMIESANLYDQGLLDIKRFPRIRKRWDSIYKPLY